MSIQSNTMGEQDLQFEISTNSGSWKREVTVLKQMKFEITKEKARWSDVHRIPVWPRPWKHQAPQEGRLKQRRESRMTGREDRCRVTGFPKALPLTQTGGHQHLLPYSGMGGLDQLRDVGTKLPHRAGVGMVLKAGGIRESAHIKK